MKKKTKIIILIAVIAAVPLILFPGMGAMFREELSIIGSIRKTDDGGFYMMEFKDGYHLDEIIEKDISSDQELADVLTGYISHGFVQPPEAGEQHIGCSALTCKNKDGNMMWGRNFDWEYSVPIIIRSTPSDGYASAATCEFTNMTGDPAILPEGTENSLLAVGAYFVPVDGINEKGLCAAVLEVNEGGQELIDTGKPDITVTMALRLILDRAATVDEALALLEKYDICPSGGISLHMAISDSSGRAVAVEVMNGGLGVVETPVLTNFNIKNGDTSAGGESAMNRYNTLMDAYEVSGGVMSEEEVEDAMKSVTQTEGKWHTQWTVIYDNGDASHVTYYRNGNFDSPLELEICQ